MQQVNIMVSPFGGPLRSVLTHGGPGADEHGFSLHFTLGSVYPESRVHDAFTELLRFANIPWIIARRRFCKVDLDGMRHALPDCFKAKWIRGRAQVEPEIVPLLHTGAIGLRPETKIILRLIREEVTVKQQSRIFLSHKSVNKAMERRFYDLLVQLGFEPWLDKEDVTAGDVQHRELLDGMRWSCAAAFFITPDFKDEKYLAHEIDLAVHERTGRSERFKIITLSLADSSGRRGVVPDALRPFIFKEPESELEALQEVLRALPIHVGPIESA
ncbi:MAG: toll/interleukin-1 receptor domain-containing protein [Woeseiaceae bacterium]